MGKPGQARASTIQTFWAGHRPDNDFEAENRICAAAFECFHRQGVHKTSMSDIARAAGITRPTLYKYFKNKHEVVFAAVDREAFAFAESVVAHARRFRTLESRIIETMVYVIEEFPQSQNLSLVLRDEMGEDLRARAFSDEATEVFSEMTAQPLIEVCPELAKQGTEITEVMSRFSISMILFPGRYAEDTKGLRKLIKKRILPGLLRA